MLEVGWQPFYGFSHDLNKHVDPKLQESSGPQLFQKSRDEKHIWLSHPTVAFFSAQKITSIFGVFFGAHILQTRGGWGYSCSQAWRLAKLPIPWSVWQAMEQPRTWRCEHEKTTALFVFKGRQGRGLSDPNQKPLCEDLCKVGPYSKKNALDDPHQKAICFFFKRVLVFSEAPFLYP